MCIGKNPVLSMMLMSTELLLNMVLMVGAMCFLAAYLDLSIHDW
jgi:hypothetical protein